METFSALLAICAGNSPIPGEFPTQRPVTRSLNVYFDLRPNKRLVNNREAGDLRRHLAHYDVIVMLVADSAGLKSIAFLCLSNWSATPSVTSEITSVTIALSSTAGFPIPAVIWAVCWAAPCSSASFYLDSCLFHAGFQQFCYRLCARSFDEILRFAWQKKTPFPVLSFSPPFCPVSAIFWPILREFPCSHITSIKLPVYYAFLPSPGISQQEIIDRVGDLLALNVTPVFTDFTFESPICRHCYCWPIRALRNWRLMRKPDLAPHQCDLFNTRVTASSPLIWSSLR